MESDAVFEAMASPVRRDILSVLAYRGECSAGEIADRVSPVARSSVSTHLRLLRMAGLVTGRREGRMRLCTLSAHEGAADALSFLHSLLQASLVQPFSPEGSAAAGPRPGPARSHSA